MGFRFRKSVNLGPLRINLSKSGVGYSVGGKGFRVTKKAGGGTRTTASIPGTGVSYVKDYGSGKKKASGSAPSASGGTGTTPKRPLYKRPWFVAIMVILLLGAVGSACGDSDDSQTEQDSIQQEQTTVQEDVGSQEDTTATEDTLDEDPDPAPEDKTEQEPVQPSESVQETLEATDPVQQTETPPSEPASPAKPVSEPQAQPEPEPAPVVDPEPEPEPEPEPAQETSRTVYITKTGKRYHYDGNCGNGEYIPSTLAEAEAKGLTPCEKCAGG